MELIHKQNKSVLFIDLHHHIITEIDKTGVGARTEVNEVTEMMEVSLAILPISVTKAASSRPQGSYDGLNLFAMHGIHGWSESNSYETERVLSSFVKTQN